ncbi:MAG: hypothetical protein O9972_22865 [Burkholderiales bacterium]|nr:hypothetical protein [Burkholderiales bacterium]
MTNSMNYTNLVSAHDQHKEQEIEDSILMELDEREATAGRRISPFIPPAPQKYLPKLWTEMTGKEQKDHLRKCKKGVPGYRGASYDHRIPNPEFVLWEQDKNERLRDFHGQKFGEDDGSWLVGLIKATPEEREAKFEYYDREDGYRQANEDYNDWLDTLSEEDWMRAVKGKLNPPDHIFSRMRVTVITPEQEAAQEAEKLAKDLEAHRSLVSSVREKTRSPYILSLSDLYVVEGEDILGRSPATAEELKAIRQFAQKQTKLSGLHKAMDAGGLTGPELEEMEAAKQNVSRAIGKAREKLENLAKGYDNKARQKAKDAKRKDDPERKAQVAARMREYRARKKAGVSI